MQQVFSFNALLNQGPPSPKPVMHIAYSPYLHKMYKFPTPISEKLLNPSYFLKIYKSPPIFVQFTFCPLISVVCFPLNLTMMQLRIMLYTCIVHPLYQAININNNYYY